jgi:hypothetical protein
MTNILTIVKTLFGIVVKHTTLGQYLLLGTLLAMTTATLIVLLATTHL